MKLNYRDKVMLTVVIVILVWVAGVMLFIKPAIDDVKDAQTKLDEAKVTLSDLQDRIDEDKDLDARIEEAYNQVVQISNDFYTYQQTQEATKVVDTLLGEDNIKNSNMSISEYSTVDIEPYAFATSIANTEIDDIVDEYDKIGGETEEDAEGENAEANANAADASTAQDQAAAPQKQVIGNYTISFDFEGELEDVKTFCDKLKSNEFKTLLVNELSLKFDEDGSGNLSDSKVKGSMNLNMYVLKKLQDPNV
ncbi:MAG: hypothetical protein J5994_05295 [Ruminococcus sp.]|nr:hypothetical protein [Ruminococcus sp.]